MVNGPGKYNYLIPRLQVRILLGAPIKRSKELAEFKVGDKVEVIKSYDNYKVGDVEIVTGIQLIEGLGGVINFYCINGDPSGAPADYFKKVGDLYEDQWYLNDGKVEIPDDADKLEKDGSVVAFRKRISPKHKFGDILIGKCTETEYRFIKYDNTGISKDRYATLLNSLDSIIQAQNLDNYRLKTND